MTARSWVALFAALAPLGASACDVGQSPSTALGEPVIVPNAQFVPGAMPVGPALPDAGSADTDAGPAPLSVLLVSTPVSEVAGGIAARER